LLKKILAFSLIFSFSLSLILQNQGVFGSNLEQQKTEAPSLANAPTVFVHFAQPKPSVRAVVESGKQVTAGAECLLSLGNTQDLVQPTAGLNLNQPANCFNLQIAFQRAVNPKLSVSANEQTFPKVVVVIPPAKIQSPSLAPAPVTGRLPVLPLAAFVFLVSLFELKKLPVSKSFKATSSFKSIFSLHRLMVLRC